MSELESGFRISDVVAMVKRRLPIVAVAALVGLVAGYLVFASAPETYSATARVQVRPILLDQFDTNARDETVNIPTEIALVKSDEVANAVREELGLSGDNRAILSNVAVVAETDSLVLKITYEADTARRAQAGANAVANGYLDQRMASAAALRDSAVERLNSEISAAQAALTEANDAVAAAPDGTPQQSEARAAAQVAQNDLQTRQDQRAELNQFDPSTVGDLVREAALPTASTSKKAIGKGVGTFGLFLVAGLAVAWLVDRRDGLGGGRQRIEKIVPGANVRVMPGAGGGSASPAEVDTAIDRLAVELVAGGAAGKASSVLVIGAGMEPPVALAEELASSLAFAGIPALFVLAGNSEREPRQAQTIASFADLVAGPSVAGPVGLPAEAGMPTTTTTSAPTVTWLRPKGSAEAAGLLRRTVVETLITRAGRERFEAVVFVAPSPTRTAAGAGLGQWVDRTAIVVAPDERPNAEAVATALAEAEVRVTEVVWT